MNGEWAECPECSITELRISRQEAFDRFFRTKKGDLARRRVVREFVGDRADPTAMAELACGHVVMA